MQIEVFVLCLKAKENEGRLSLEDIANELHVDKYPCTIPSLSIAVRIRFDRSEQGDQDIRIRFMDDDGRAVMKDFHELVNINIEGHVQPRSYFTRSLELKNLEIKSSGEYSLTIVKRSLSLISSSVNTVIHSLLQNSNRSSDS